MTPHQPPNPTTPIQVRNFWTDLYNAQRSETSPRTIQTLHQYFPPPDYSIKTATDLALQRAGIDLIVIHNPTGTTTTVQVKTRSRDYSDVLLEHVSVVENNVPGWLFTTQAAFILILYPARAALLPVPHLRKAYETYSTHWHSAYRTITTSTERNGKIYHSQSLAVPTDVLLQAMNQVSTTTLPQGNLRT